MAEVIALDTHALIFWATNQMKKFGRDGRGLIEAFESGRVRFVVPAPVVLETWFLERGGHIQVPVTFGAWWDSLLDAGLEEISMTAGDVQAASRLNWKHDDPFDRLIAAMALRAHAPLMTRDEALVAWGGLPTVW